MMTCLIHKSYGRLGSEFVIHHQSLHRRKLFIALFSTVGASFLLKLHEMDILFLWMVLGLTGAAVVFRILSKVSKETLLVVPSLGVEVKTQYWLGHEKTQFFDRSCVKDIIINEAVTMQSVIHYLAVLLTSSRSGQVEQVYPLFTHSWPRLEDLVLVYQAVQDIWGNQCFKGLNTKPQQTSIYGSASAVVTHREQRDLRGGGDDRLRLRKTFDL